VPAGRRAFCCLEEFVYAVVRTGGKQYRVEEGRALKVERLPGEVGDTVELGDVLLMADGSAVTVGAPTIAGARVLGTIAEQGRAPKIIVFKYKAKTRYRKKTGHRQPFTRVIVDDILLAGQEPKPKQAPEPETAATEEVPKGRRGRRKAEAGAAPVEATAAEDTATAEVPTVTDEVPAPAEESSAAAEPVEEASQETPKRGRRKKTE
jgi:large subunit ribosomal protein L21